MKTSPATGPCTSCNWTPDTPHPGASDSEWKFAEWPDDFTWLCPACGMPNAAQERTGADAPAEPTTVDVPVLAPPPVGSPAENGGGDDGEGVGGSPLPRMEPAPGPSPIAETLNAVEQSVELLRDFETMLDALELNTTVTLPAAEPDPFTVSDLLAGVHATTTKLLGIELGLAVWVMQALASVGSPDPATLEGGNESGD